MSWQLGLVLLCVFAIVMVVAILVVEHRVTKNQYVQNRERHRPGYFVGGDAKRQHKW